jgi:hypothetical protein
MMTAFIIMLVVIIVGSNLGVLLAFVLLCKLGAIPTKSLPKWLQPWSEHNE